jgi:hypothetical protein
MAMRNSRAVVLASIVGLLLGSCSGGGKKDVALTSGQVYQLQSSGKMKVFPSAGSDGAKGAVPIHRLRVKRKNEDPAAKTAGCWLCTDCICNADDCACTECTSC